MTHTKVLWLFSLLFVLIESLSAQNAVSKRILDLNPGAAGSYPSNLTVFGASLLFDANTPDKGTELWRYDGRNISLAADVNDTVFDFGGAFLGNSSTPNWLTVLSGGLYFSAWEPRHGAELWRYDESSIKRVADISADANDNIKQNPNSSWPSNLTILNSMLYFSANNSTTRTNFELWRYNGNTVEMIANIHPDNGTNYSSYPTGLTAFNNALYFMADDGANGFELWKYEGTKATLVTNINPGGAGSSSYPKYFTEAGTSLFFQAYNSEFGYELWRTDGVNSTMVDINPDAASSYPEFFTVLNGVLYFRANDGAHGFELWKVANETASLAADINPAGDSFPRNLVAFGSALYFAADDGVHGWELWKYDGSGASLIDDINPSGDSFPENLTVFNNALYFSATTPETGFELWKFDGQKVSLVADLNPGSGDSYPRLLTAFGSELVFTAAEDGVSDWELWTLKVENVKPSSPQISSVSREGSTLRILVSAAAGSTVALESSIDFSSWAESASSVSDGTVSFSVTADQAKGFFRAVIR